MYWYYKLIIVVFFTVLLFYGVKLATPYFVKEDVEHEKRQNIHKKNISPEKIAKIEMQPVKKKLKKASVELEFVKLMDKANKVFLQEKYDDALTLYYSLLGKVKMFSTQWILVTQKISFINTQLTNTGIPSRRKVAITVEPNRLLQKIAYQYFTTHTQIMKVNNIKNDRSVYAGRSVHFYPGPWKISVYKSKFILILYNRGKLFKVYSIGVGKNNRTPEGKFTIFGKVI